MEHPGKTDMQEVEDILNALDYDDEISKSHSEKLAVCNSDKDPIDELDHALREMFAEGPEFVEQVLQELERRNNLKLAQQKLQQPKPDPKTMGGPQGLNARRAASARKRYEKKAGRTVRAWNDLSALTDEEFAAYKKAQAKIRKDRFNKRQKAL